MSINAAREALGLPEHPDDQVYLVIRGTRTVLEDGTAAITFGAGGQRKLLVTPGEPGMHLVPELAALALAVSMPW